MFLCGKVGFSTLNLWSELHYSLYYSHDINSTGHPMQRIIFTAITIRRYSYYISWGLRPTKCKSSEQQGNGWLWYVPEQIQNHRRSKSLLTAGIPSAAMKYINGDEVYRLTSNDKVIITYANTHTHTASVLTPLSLPWIVYDVGLKRIYNIGTEGLSEYHSSHCLSGVFSRHSSVRGLL